MNNLSEPDIQSLRDALVIEQVSLRKDLAMHGEQHDGVWNARSEESGEEADHTDTADKIEELITNVPIVNDLEARLHDVEDAVKKIDSGMYGICEVGNEPISLDRLKANPTARTCVAHAT